MTAADSNPSDDGQNQSEDGQNQIKEVLERAIADPEFGRLLLDDPDTALEGYELSEVQLLLLRSLDEEDLAKLTPENLDAYFAVDSAVYTPEDSAMVQTGYDLYDSDDLD